MASDRTPLLLRHSDSHQNIEEDLQDGDTSHADSEISHRVDFISSSDQRSYRCEILATFFIMMGAFSFGITFGFASPSVAQLKSDGILTDGQTSWYESVMNLGNCFGGAVAGFLVEYVGRKLTHLLTALPFIGGWLCICASGKSYPLLILGRLLTGFGGGVVPISYGLYVAEIASKEIRGTMLMGFQTGAAAGILAAYAFGLVLNVQWLATVAIIPSVVMVVGTCFIPESPRWLLKNHRATEALAALAWFRRSSGSEISSELEEMKIHIQRQDILSGGSFNVGDLLHSIKPFSLCLSFVLLQQLCGISIVLYNIQEIFEEAGYPRDNNHSQYAVIIVGVVKFVTTFLTTTVIDRFGRRPPFILGGFMMAFSCIVFGFYFYYKHVMSVDYSWVPLTCLMIYISGYGIGWGGIPWLLLPELLPLKIRGLGSGIATAAMWFTCFLMTKEYNTLLHMVALYGLFWIFGTLCLIGSIYACVVLPETNQRSLEKIESLTCSVARS